MFLHHSQEAPRWRRKKRESVNKDWQAFQSTRPADFLNGRHCGSSSGETGHAGGLETRVSGAGSVWEAFQKGLWVYKLQWGGGGSVSVALVKEEVGSGRVVRKGIMPWSLSSGFFKREGGKEGDDYRGKGGI